VECVVPFLDRELAELPLEIFRRTSSSKDSFIPPQNTFSAARCRDVLRPPKCCGSRKRFAAPWHYWLANDLREMVDDLLSETTFGKRGFAQKRCGAW